MIEMNEPVTDIKKVKYKSTTEKKNKERNKHY